MYEEELQPSTNAFALTRKVILLPTPPTNSGSHINIACSLGSRRVIFPRVTKGYPNDTASTGSAIGSPLGCTLIKVVLALLKTNMPIVTFCPLAAFEGYTKPVTFNLGSRPTLGKTFNCVV